LSSLATFTAFFDANVLYSALVRDLLMNLTNTGLFRPKWSRAVQDEWITNLLENRPDLKPEQLERTRLLMDKHVPDALVTGYESLVEGLLLPDPDDRHVLAAAIHGRADVIVTENLRDFPAEFLAPFGIEAQHPDEFVLHLLDLAPGVVCRAADHHRQTLKKPPKTIEEYVGTLEAQGLTQTASVLREYMF
jgi:predicted nucleic acid-binding protein